MDAGSGEGFLIACFKSENLNLPDSVRATLIPHQSGTASTAQRKWRSPTTRVTRSNTRPYDSTWSGRRARVSLLLFSSKPCNSPLTTARSTREKPCRTPNSSNITVSASPMCSTNSARFVAIRIWASFISSPSIIPKERSSIALLLAIHHPWSFPRLFSQTTWI